MVTPDTAGSRNAHTRSCARFIVQFVTTCLLALAITCRPPELDKREPIFIFGDTGLGPGQFVYPRALAVAPDQKIYVVDKTARIQRFSERGDYELHWQLPEWQAGKPTGLTVDKAGRVLVADTHYHRVVIYDPDGKELDRFGSEGTQVGQFGLPTRVAVDDEGCYYVSEYGGNDRITKFSPRFEPLLAFGTPDSGDSALQRPQALLFDEHQELWVADACHHRVCRFDRQGKLLSTFGRMGRAAGQLQFPYDLALCQDGTLLVAEYGNNRVQHFDRQGRSLGIWGRAGRKPGELSAPWGVAVGPNRWIYVLDSGNNRIQVLGG